MVTSWLNSQYATSKIAHHISFKGNGGLDFDCSTVDSTLSKNEGKEVNVLIDSLGWSLATGLYISAAFKNHGKVNVYFIELNASAATIVSLGAVNISIDAGAISLVYQCSMTMSYALRLLWCKSRNNFTILYAQYII